MGVFGRQFNSIMSKVKRVADFQGTAKAQYAFAYEQGRLSGYLLAFFLLNSDFARGKAISLLGYSAGTVVTFNCCKAMKDLYGEGFPHATRVLHDMQLWAGSFVLDRNRQFEERMEVAQYCSFLSGTVTNLYSEGDVVLRYGQPMVHSEPGTTSIGMQQILVDIPEDEDGEIGCKRAVNIDVTQEAMSHHGYQKAAISFLPKIPLGY